MAFDITKPADNQTIAAGPADIRENLRALQEDKVVNAQKVMDLSPGNASGNIPVANGNLCVNLNAEKLGGNLASGFATAGHTHAAVTTSSNGLMINTDKAKLNGIATGAEVNQNAFSNILVGTTTIQADGKTDTLELAAGANITITPDATNDRVTIAVSGTVDTASNANALGSLDVGQFIHTCGEATGDWNNYRRPGMYTVDEWTDKSNYPAGAYAWGTLVVFRGCSGDIRGVGQLYLSHNGSQMFYRGGFDTGRWDVWKQIATVDGNIATATKLQTARTINGVSFDGSANISITAPANGGTSGACSGNAATASKLLTARTISLQGIVTGNGSFDGSGNISISTTGGSPTGMVAMFGALAVPNGWLECNGATVSRTQYAALYSAIGTMYGSGDGSTTFNLPDLRGEFIRGWDHSRGVDPGRALGSFQNHEVFSHKHTITSTSTASSSSPSTGYGAMKQSGVVYSAETGLFGGSETRPRNIALMYCIKY